MILAIVAASASAAVIDEPVQGGRSLFYWQELGDAITIANLGPDDGVSAEEGSTQWDFVLESPSFFGVSLQSYNRPPISFQLVVDNVEVAWATAEQYQVEVSPQEIFHHFDASLTGLLLPQGHHIVTIAPSFRNVDGAASVQFLPMTPVPEPATLLLFLYGLLMLSMWWICTAPRAVSRMRADQHCGRSA